MTATTRQQILRSIEQHNAYIARESRRDPACRPAVITERLATYRAKVAALWARLAADMEPGVAAWYQAVGDRNGEG